MKVLYMYVSVVQINTQGPQNGYPIFDYKKNER